MLKFGHAESRKKPFLWCLAVLMLAAAVIVVSAGWVNGAGGSAQKSLLTIDGYQVSEEEFQFYLYDERALTANTFYLKYGADADADFWDRSFDGQTPMEFARENALEKLLTAKMEALIAVENKLIDQDISFASIMEEREDKNKERKRMLEKEETFYGLSSFDEYQYYNYFRNEIWSKLLTWYLDNTKVEESELQVFYDENKEMFQNGSRLEYMLLWEDGSTEVLTQTENDISKADTQTLYLWYELDKLEAGEQLKQTEYKGKLVDALLISKEELGHKSMQEVKGLLLQLYGEEQLRLMVEERVQNAKVEIDRQKFDRIRFAQ